MTMADRLPDHPRLASGCCVLDDGETVLVRSTRGSLRIDPEHRSTMLRVLDELDGTRDLVLLLGDEQKCNLAFEIWAGIRRGGIGGHLVGHASGARATGGLLWCAKS